MIHKCLNYKRLRIQKTTNCIISQDNPSTKRTNILTMFVSNSELFYLCLEDFKTLLNSFKSVLKLTFKNILFTLNHNKP